MNSFDFHSSPRMIPHICKPDVQFVELSIEQFVPSGKKVKSDQTHGLAFKDKISDSVAELLAKYFHSSRENTWKPSLVAFPHFQAFPPRVHKVKHSFRTGILIDTIQYLQGLSFCKDSEILEVQVQVHGRLSDLFLGGETIGQDYQSEQELTYDSPKAHSHRKISDLETSPAMVSNCKEKHYMPNTSGHGFLFGCELVSLDAFGMVSITSVPALPFTEESSHCKSIAAKKNSFPNFASCGDHGEPRMQAKVIQNLTNPAEARCINHDLVLFPSLDDSDPYEERTLVGVERIVLQTPSPKGNFINSEDHIAETPASVRKKISILLAKESTDDYKDIEMSPRLTNMVGKGVVPESPIDLQEKSIPTINSHFMELPNYKVSSYFGSPVHVSSVKLCNDLCPKELISDKNHNVKLSDKADARGSNSASVNNKIQTPLVTINSCVNSGHLSASLVNDENQTPFVNLTNNCSKDWHLSSGEASISIQQVPKLKRLRKYGESCKIFSSKTMKENFSGPVAFLSRSSTSTRPGLVKRTKVKQKQATHVELFIEDEAEVSSDDEEEDKACNSYDDSFIDDRTNPETASTQAEASGNDMMAIYRRSLLSQSPMESHLHCSNDFSSDTLLCGIKTDESGRPKKIGHSIQTYQTCLQSVNQSAVGSFISCQMDPGRISLVAMPGETSATTKEEGRKMESRKRKPSYRQGGYGPASSIQPKRLFQLEGIGNSSSKCQDDNNELNEDLLSDDQFYES